MNLNLKCLSIAFCLLLGAYSLNAQTKNKDAKVVDERMQISVVDVRGDDNIENGVDIRELQEYKIIEEDDDKPFMIVEQMPQFVGGIDSLMTFIQRNLSYPVEAVKDGIQGRVILRFVVNKKGKVVDARVMRGIDPFCDKEALRVIRLMPDWIPGKQNGRNVSTYFTIPIVFRLPVDKTEAASSETKEEETN